MVVSFEKAAERRELIIQHKKTEMKTDQVETPKP
jgi:hypothetical protein